MTTYGDPRAQAVEAEILDLLRSRWSTRIYDPTHELSEADLASLFEAARWAPSAGNSQPWGFIVNRRGEPGHQRFVEALSRGNTGWAPRASALVLTLHQSGDPDDPSFIYSDYAAYDLGQSVAHLTVQAQSMGLSAHQFAGFDHARLAEAYQVPSHWTVTTGIAIGRRAGADVVAATEESLRERESRPRERKPLADLVFAEKFGEPRLLG